VHRKHIRCNMSQCNIIKISRRFVNLLTYRTVDAYYEEMSNSHSESSSNCKNYRHAPYVLLELDQSSFQYVDYILPFLTPFQTSKLTLQVAKDSKRKQI
jgi:hypothetical protein